MYAFCDRKPTTFECIFFDWPFTTGAIFSALPFIVPEVPFGRGMLVFVVAVAAEAEADAAKRVDAPRLKYLLEDSPNAAGCCCCCCCALKTTGRRRRRAAALCMQQRNEQSQNNDGNALELRLPRLQKVPVATTADYAAE